MVKEAFAFSFAAYSCHGRWYDAEGTQFVIATQLAPGTGWSNENNRPQPYRNSRRLCFMYKESGGVVSLTASEVACQRGIPPPPPMLAFNATSTGEYLPPPHLRPLHSRGSLRPSRKRLGCNEPNCFVPATRQESFSSFERSVSRFTGTVIVKGIRRDTPPFLFDSIIFFPFPPLKSRRDGVIFCYFSRIPLFVLSFERIVEAC